MGTSQSSLGPTGKSPLVPPWADGAPSSPPPVHGARLKSFRTQLGKAITGGDRSHIHKALGHYARTATGGSANALIRLSGAMKAGTALIGALGGISSGSSEPAIDLSKLTGLPIEKAIAIIVNGLTTVNGDSDRIASAMSSALINALDGVETFDQSAISEDLLADVMINYLSECIFLMIMNDAGPAMGKARDAMESIRIESDLGELIRVIVDRKMQGVLGQGSSMMRQSKIENLEREVIAEVWKEWESYR